MPWDTQLLRLTLFLRAPLDGAGAWEKATRVPPETDENRPRESTRRQFGHVGDAGLLLLVTPARLDWMMGPPLPSRPTAAAGAFLGDALNTAGSFTGIIAPWLGATPDIKALRIAFGLTAVTSTPDKSTAYDRLQELVPSVRFDAARMREVVYLVNRPAPSRHVDGMELNRITKWSALYAQPLFMATSEAVSSSPPSAETLSYLQCECDNSTPAERVEAFANDQLVPIYEELRDLALANLERGEIP